MIKSFWNFYSHKSKYLFKILILLRYMISNWLITMTLKKDKFQNNCRKLSKMINKTLKLKRKIQKMK